jgi:hypothetical protein
MSISRVRESAVPAPGFERSFNPATLPIMGRYAHEVEASSRMRARGLALVAGLVAGAAACGGDDGVDLPVPAELRPVAATDAQTGPAGGRLPEPLAVTVLAADGTPVPRAQIQWQVTGGTGASLSAELSASDGNGRAQAFLTLGPAVGAYEAQASLATNAGVSVTFTATATDPPAITAVTVPANFTGGDTITIEGTGFVAGVEVDVGGRPARVLSVAGDGTSLMATAPICLTPGIVTIQVRLGLAVSNGFDATYEASTDPLQLAVGDYASIDPEQLGSCALFPDAGPGGAEYLLAPQSVTGTPSRMAGYRVSGDAVSIVVAQRRPDGREPTVASRFHDFLRAQELEMARVPKPRREPEAASLALAAPPDVGDRRNFRVCSSVTCSAADDFAQVTAEVRYVGERAVIYQDVDAPSNVLTAQDFQEIGSLFDSDLYGVDTQAFGAESDVDQNGLIYILMSPVVNALTEQAQCEVAFITGFFFAIDIDPAFQNDERSNKAEVFYSITPDPDGDVSCDHSEDRIRRLVPVTFIHEFQHMINYNQHVLLRNGSGEMVWLNEAMSHLAEELGALHFEDVGNDDLFNRFAIGDVFNAYQYLKDPGAYFLLYTQGTGTLEERGSGWLFVRWLSDQFGDGVIRRLSETGFTGAENVEAATGEPLERLLSQWLLANYVSDLPDFEAPPRLRYLSWQFRTTYESLNQQDPDTFDRPFPLVPTEFSGGTFMLDGTLRSGSGDFVRVVQGAGQAGFTLEFTSPGGGDVDPAVAPRLNVIRLR